MKNKSWMFRSILLTLLIINTISIIDRTYYKYLGTFLTKKYRFVNISNKVINPASFSVKKVKNNNHLNIARTATQTPLVTVGL